MKLQKLITALLITSLVTIFINCATTNSMKIKNIQRENPSVQREFRAAWVATVANIDWPSKPGLSTEEQQREAIAILDTAKNLNLNAIIFQVRPQCDAFYKSELEPWSYYLTGKQGIAPDPYYDPLEFWIEESHKRGLELHAWFNPYRAHHPVGGEVSKYSIIKRRPELVKKLKGGYYWLDPTKKSVQDHSLAVVMDVVKRYDVDGIHFDDYFYPYPTYNENEDFPDDDTWKEYKSQGGKLERGDWRRDGVNTFIKNLYKAIKKEKPYVKFGLSPFGMYRPNVPASIKGFDQYEVLYADARLWLNEGWVDYWTPQLYWPINQINQSFPVLLGWWSKENFKNRNIWPGLYTSKFQDEKGIDEIINEIMISRGITMDAPGHVHFSMKPLLNNDTLLLSLKNGPYKQQAIVPESPWLDNKKPEAPQVNIGSNDDELSVSWNHDNIKDVFQYVLYYKRGANWNYKVFPKNEYYYNFPVYIESTDTLNSEPIKLESITKVGVSAIDRTGNESNYNIIKIGDLNNK